ncbi:hypothetical protein DOY81_011696 [Sarcophaga bullata]|nr:hypothetical protein DOY81_011696 [Sarcophaga bullata]
MLARIWKPDTYFYNGKQSYLHTITTPNKFVRIYQKWVGLTIKAGCPMNLEDFLYGYTEMPFKIWFLICFGFIYFHHCLTKSLPMHVKLLQQHSPKKIIKTPTPAALNTQA